MAQLNVENIVAIRIDATQEYKINNQGNLANMPAGVTVVGKNVKTFDFTNTGFVVEIMSNNLTIDKKGKELQGFAPDRIELI